LGRPTCYLCTTDCRSARWSGLPKPERRARKRERPVSTARAGSRRLVRCVANAPNGPLACHRCFRRDAENCGRDACARESIESLRRCGWRRRMTNQFSCCVSSSLLA
jgi:hypothetical protein